MFSRWRELPAYNKKDIKDIKVEEIVVRADLLTIKNSTLSMVSQTFFCVFKDKTSFIVNFICINFITA